jgi:hypothetical protein
LLAKLNDGVLACLEFLKETAYCLTLLVRFADWYFYVVSRFDEDVGKVELDYPRDMSMWSGVGYNIDTVFQWKDGEY